MSLRTLTSWAAVPVVLLWSGVSSAESDHLFNGAPSMPFHERQGYVTAYDQANRIPSWVAYRVEPASLEGKPARKGKYKRFRTDTSLPNPVSTGEYTNSGFARGHLAPWAVMGGDRDGDGKFAKDNDPEDNQTIFEANFMSNITPQKQDNFNGAGGLWFKLETWVRKKAVEQAQLTVWVTAGVVLGPGELEKIGPQKNIAVPPMFFKIVVREVTGKPVALAFLFPHQRKRHGAIENFLVSVDVVEQLTGLDFFHELDDAVEAELEATDTFENWETFLPDGG